MVKEVKSDLYISLVVMVKSFVWMHKPSLVKIGLVRIFLAAHGPAINTIERACQEHYSIIHRRTTKQVYILILLRRVVPVEKILYHSVQ